MAKYPLVAVVAMAENRVIGDGKKLLWHIPDELKRTKMRTMGRPLIMGRRTFETIGRALPGRANIVLTRRQDWQADGVPDGVIVVHSMEDAITAAEAWIDAETEREKEIIIFGGAEIYRLFLPMLHAIDATLIEANYPSNNATTFPESDWERWTEDPTYPSTRTEAHGTTPAYRYVRYVPSV